MDLEIRKAFVKLLLEVSNFMDVKPGCWGRGEGPARSNGDMDMEKDGKDKLYIKKNKYQSLVRIKRGMKVHKSNGKQENF